MSESRSVWLVVLQWSFWAVLMAATMAWLGSSRSRPVPGRHAQQLVQPRSLLVIAFPFAARVR